MKERDSDLFTPSLSEWRPIETAQPPWRLRSQYWLALLGGPAAVTAIAVLNARRLQLSAKVQHRMVLGGVLVVLLEFAIAWMAIVGFGLAPDRGARARLLPRWSVSLLNLLWAAALVRWQTPAARQYESFGRGQFASLWRPGFLAAFASAVLLGLPFLWFLWMTGRLPLPR
jgi:hypothetical protein